MQPEGRQNLSCDEIRNLIADKVNVMEELKDRVLELSFPLLNISLRLGKVSLDCHCLGNRHDCSLLTLKQQEKDRANFLLKSQHLNGDSDLEQDSEYKKSNYHRIIGILLFVELPLYCR